MKIFITIAMLFFCLIKGTGQPVSIPIKEFLAATKLEDKILYQKKKFDFLQGVSHELPIIDKLELRTETEEFNFLNQSFLLRATPNSFRSIKAQRLFQESNLHLTQMELDCELEQALKERYELLINYIYAEKELAIYQKQKVLLRDKVTLLERSISLPRFDILDLIDAQDQEQKIIREILSLENAIQTYQQQIQRAIKNNRLLQINHGNLLTISQLKTYFQKPESSKPLIHNDLALLSAKAYNSALEYEFEASKNKFSLGYIQAKYGDAFDEKFTKSFSIGVGFDIPLKSASKLNLKEIEVQTFELESQYIATKNDLTEHKNALKLSLDNLLQQYDLVQLQLSDSQVEFALKEYSKIAEAAPVVLLKMRENTLHKELILQKLEFEIMQNFITYLAVSGELAQAPLRNYLSVDFEEF